MIIADADERLLRVHDLGHGDVVESGLPPVVQPAPGRRPTGPSRYPRSANDRPMCRRQAPARAFHGTDLDVQLRRRGVTGIVLGGVVTSLGVESTGRAGYDHGYNLTFADAMTNPDPAAHEHSVRVTFPKFGEIDTGAAINAALPPAS
jgi:hypothetical protein